MKRPEIMVLILVLLVAVVFLTGCEPPKPDSTPLDSNSSPLNPNPPLLRKPVIYLYPTSEQVVTVQLDFEGELTCTYPAYTGRWHVIAQPDGTLTNLADNREYSYLFWEGISDYNWDMSKGFVVKGSETVEFLQEKLEYLGLTPGEANDFIVYWLPVLQENEYNLITFAGQEYENVARLRITPRPDSVLRVFMVFKPLSKPAAIEEQELKPFIRKGFTVVEWGGTEVN